MLVSRFWSRAGAVFALVYVWKIVLLLLTAQPVPMSDAFFYDGPVVNWLLNGSYTNPSLALVLPISGTKVFSAYPPLYQAVLLGWMTLFGPSAISAVAFHAALFGIYLLLLLAILRRLEAPVWAVHVAGAFLLGMTFHDRPDTLATVFGMAAVYAWIRSRPGLAGASAAWPSSGWPWAMAAFVSLTFCTSLQVGAIYLSLVWFGALLMAMVGKGSLPWAPLLATLAGPAALAALVVLAFPEYWAGFREHAGATPALLGLGVPSAGDLLRTLRTVPGVLVAACLVPWLCLKGRDHSTGALGVRGLAPWASTPRVLTLAATVVAAGVVLVSTFSTLLSPSAHVTAYLQPLVVAGCLAWAAVAGFAEPRQLRALLWLLLAAAGVGWIRPIGMTTWGLACARDAGYGKSVERVRTELANCGPGDTAVLSAAYLYEAARHKEIRAIHCDWLLRYQWQRRNGAWDGLRAARPAKLILTQFDYYRQFQPVLAQLEARPDLVELRTANTAGIPAPDSSRSLQRVVQNISWAPVIVSFQWK
jgi:hypothetical protein